MCDTVWIVQLNRYDGGTIEGVFYSKGEAERHRLALEAKHGDSELFGPFYETSEYPIGAA